MGYEHSVVYGLYENFEDAASAIRHLSNEGYDTKRVTVIVNDADGRLKKYTDDEWQEDPVTAEEGAGFGAVVGALTALGMSVIPGIGPILSAGPLGVAIATAIGATTGAATGAAIAEVVEFDIDKADANRYAKVIKEGGALLAMDVYTDWHEERIEEILETYNPLDVEDIDFD